MRCPSLLPLFFTLVFSASFLNAQTSAEVLHAPDGNTREITSSIFIPPLPNAPFSATVTTVWTKQLEDGTSVTIQNHRMVMRDSQGRIFQERRTFVPKGSADEPQLRWTEISDPVTHTRYVCLPGPHTCDEQGYFAPTKISNLPTGPLDDKGNRTLTRENLGSNTMSGLDVTGTRETMTIAIGVIGNDKPVSVTKEFWYSPQLGINIVVKRADPRSGTQTFTVSNISLAEPDPANFALPAGFKVNDQRPMQKNTAAVVTNGN